MSNEGLDRIAIVCDDEQSYAVLVGSVVEHFGYRVHTCTTAPDAIGLAEDLDPDLVIIDLDLGEGPTGIDVMLRIKQQLPWTAGVILTGHRSPKLVRKDHPSHLEGVSYLVKADLHSTDDLQLAIQAAIEGIEVHPIQPGDLPRLTTSQAELLRMINDGFSNEQIAAGRNCTLRAVQRMISRLYLTLGIEDSQSGSARVIAARMYRDGKVTTC